MFPVQTNKMAGEDMGGLYKIHPVLEKYCRICTMMDDLERRRKLTFSQAQGLAELPGPLNLEEMPRSFRLGVWSVIYKSIQEDTATLVNNIGRRIYWLHNRWEAMSVALWVEHFEMPSDEFPKDARIMHQKCKDVILDDQFNEVFDFLTVLMRHSQCPNDLSRSIGNILQAHQMAYYLDTNGPPTFIPQSSPQEGEAVCAAMSVLAESGIGGAHRHLLNAAEAINGKKFADAVRESIHAVESVAKVISRQEGATLGSAIKKLEERQLLTHGALAEGFKNLYGYTNDEKGVRHSLLNKGDANVGQEEAVFMFGACASFCGYLCRKQAKMSAKN